MIILLIIIIILGMIQIFLFVPFLLFIYIFILFRFVKGSKPGVRTGFDFDEADLAELEQFREVIVASAIFGTAEQNWVI